MSLSVLLFSAFHSFVVADALDGEAAGFYALKHP